MARTPTDGPLSDAELDRLDELLRNRIDDDAVEDDTDEGVVSVSELDGFLTAVVSGPVTLVPSAWLPALWGDLDPSWDDQEDADEFMSLVIRHMNGIVDTLMDAPETFEPLFLESGAVDPPALVVDEWCEGYARAVDLVAADWAAAGDSMAELVEPILAFASDTNWRGHELDDSAEAARLRDSIAPNVRAIHAYWLARRSEAVPAPIVRGAPRIGRNDPCPCGSGKKYKRCCLQ